MENGKHPSPLQLQLQLQLQQLPPPPPPPPYQTPLWKVVVVASIGVGVQFGWALQFSLLTPYVQLLGIPHKWASYIWLCGPISGLVVQPLTGLYSDRCTSRFGRRRPFIATGAALVAVAVILIGFAADLGHLSGDRLDSGAAKPRAITIFVVGFWILDVGNNLLMDPCRAFLADLTDGDQRKTRNASAFYAFFTAVGQVLGYAAGSYSKLHRLLPFTSTQACNVYCANLKTCFLISITLLLILTILALSTVGEDPISRFSVEKKDKAVPFCGFFGELLSALKEYPRPMWYLLLAMGLNSTAWFGFKMYDTDWVGREVYGGKVGGKLYSSGVRAGSLGLMLMAAVAGVAALVVMLVVRGVKGGNRLWGCGNLLFAVCLAMTVCITKVAESTRRHAVASGGGTTPALGVKAGTLSLFAVMGIAQAVRFDIKNIKRLFGKAIEAKLAKKRQKRLISQVTTKSTLRRCWARLSRAILPNCPERLKSVPLQTDAQIRAHTHPFRSRGEEERRQWRRSDRPWQTKSQPEIELAAANNNHLLHTQTDLQVRICGLFDLLFVLPICVVYVHNSIGSWPICWLTVVIGLITLILYTDRPPICVIPKSPL